MYALYLLPPRIRRIALPLTVLGVAIVYPILWANELNGTNALFEIPIFKAFPNMDTMVAIVIFAMMAIGLNIVVGYAGLLDLGYVAFYAIGAYMAAWFASPHFSSIDFELGAVGVPPDVDGFHISIWLLLVIAAVTTAVAGVLIGLPTLRLRGDYLAIVTLGFGEIIYRVAVNGDADGISALLDRETEFNLTNGAFGINPVDPPGFGGWLSDKLGLPANFIVENGSYVNFVSLVYWSAIGLLLFTSSAASGCETRGSAAPGSRSERTRSPPPRWGSRSCGRRRGHMRAARSSADWPERGTAPSSKASSPTTSCSTSRSSSSAWSFSAGWATFGGRLPAPPSSRTWTRKGSRTSRAGSTSETSSPSPAIRSRRIPSRPISAGCLNAPLLATGIYGAILVLAMLFRPQGLIPEERRKREIEEGVHDEPLMDVES